MTLGDAVQAIQNTLGDYGAASALVLVAFAVAAWNIAAIKLLWDGGKK